MNLAGAHTVVRSLLVATLVACGLQFSSSRTLAQAPPRGAGPQGGSPPAANFDPASRASVQTSRPSSPVAVIDLLYIFENHPGFQERKAQMDRAKEQKEKELLGKRDTLKAKASRLKEYKPGTSEYSTLESELAQDEAALQIALKKANQEFIVAEGKMYYQTYQEVLDVVKWYASQRGIAMVLRYTGKEVNPDNPEEIMKEMNEQVVYYHDAVNITGDILNQIKSRYQPQVGRLPANPAQRPLSR
jgi:Skp family chaperone for outer membrane proteins